ncbi:MAG: prepilin-type N-terminal cleavage/methylation domain-containing protein [Pirellulales bacterium]|nr:prepilin-type N-terminal cleavage/methylation domain-containing protein [Pirellulales bacterium]
MTKLNQPKRGFSLLELMVVVTIIGTIAAIIIARASDNITNAEVKACLHNRSIINAAAERYALMESSAPANISDLDDPDYLEGAVLTCPVTGNAYVLNSSTNRVQGHTTTATPGNH